MGTGGDNPTATLYGNFKCPYTREFVLGNLTDVVREFVAPGNLDLRFFDLAYEPDNHLGRDSPTHGTETYFISSSDPRIARVSLGAWEVDPQGYWRYFRDSFEDPPSGWVTYDDLRSRLHASDVSGVDEIIRRAKTDRYEDELRHVEDAAVTDDVPFTPTLELNGHTTAPHHETSEVLDWIRHRISDGSGPPGEAGTVRTGQPDAGTWHGVGFGGDRDTPVVISQPLSAAGSHPSHPRLRGVDDGGYQFRIEEWDYLDGGHKTETAGYLAMDAGTSTLPGSTTVEAGWVTTDETVADVAFTQWYPTTPVVLTQAQTFWGGDPVVTRQRNLTRAGTSVRLQESEADGDHKNEIVGYVALEPGTSELDDRPMEAGRTGDVVTDAWHRIDFERSYDAPAFVADLQTSHGTDTAGLRYRHLDGSGVDVRVEEAQSVDGETRHVSEVVGYLVAETSG